MTKPRLKLNSKSFFYILCAVVVLLVSLAVALVVLGNGLLAKKTNRLTELKIENAVLDQQKISVIKAQKDIETYAELEQIAKSIVPQEKDQARTVRGLLQRAKESGVSIAAVSFPSSTLGQAKPGVAALPDGQIKAVTGISGVYQLEITLQSTPDAANFPKLIDFLKRLEGNRSTSQVSSLTITPNSNNRSLLTFSMVINVYLKP